MSRTQRLKRVFGMRIDKSARQPICTAASCCEAVRHRDVPDETCLVCAEVVRIIAFIEDPEVIEKILTPLGGTAAAGEASR